MTSNCIFCHLDKGHQSQAGKGRFLYISNKRVFYLADRSRSKARSWRKWLQWELKFPKSMHNQTYRWGIRGLGGCRWPISPVSTHLPLLRQHGLLDYLLVYCWACNFIFADWEFLFFCLNLYHMEISSIPSCSQEWDQRKALIPQWGKLSMVNAAVVAVKQILVALCIHSSFSKNSLAISTEAIIFVWEFMIKE